MQILVGIGAEVTPLGSKLPADRELAAMMGVSRPTVREAVLADDVHDLGPFVSVGLQFHASVVRLSGIPSPIDIPPGCAFASRCSLATDVCRAAVPDLSQRLPELAGHSVACLRADERTSAATA